MRLTDELKNEIIAIFSPSSGEPLSDAQVNEIADNLLALALHIGGQSR